jgi:hypothetical protein
MDPLSILSVAGNIIQLVDFAGKLLNGSRELYRSTTGALPVNDELELITRDLSSFVTKLERPYDDPALQDICEGSRIVATELLARLDKLKGKHAVWSSLQHAIKATWARKEIEMLNTRLSGFRKALDLHILHGIQYVFVNSRWLY